ncbi:hypothetical protein HDV00_009936 [Rhizophlyctis rosea]|nr:hypothetical protein HDV00_009936 [Rhizophlyctis rosea]
MWGAGSGAARKKNAAAAAAAAALARARGASGIANGAVSMPAAARFFPGLSEVANVGAGAGGDAMGPVVTLGGGPPVPPSRGQDSKAVPTLPPSQMHTQQMETHQQPPTPQQQQSHPPLTLPELPVAFTMNRYPYPQRSSISRVETDVVRSLTSRNQSRQRRRHRSKPSSNDTPLDSTNDGIISSSNGGAFNELSPSPSTTSFDNLLDDSRPPTSQQLQQQQDPAPTSSTLKTLQIPDSPTYLDLKLHICALTAQSNQLSSVISTTLAAADAAQSRTKELLTKKDLRMFSRVQSRVVRIVGGKYGEVGGAVASREKRERMEGFMKEVRGVGGRGGGGGGGKGWAVGKGRG